MSNELKENANVDIANTEPTYLADKNAHPRDKDMQFVESTHKYTILPDPDSKYDSVTTWNHSHFSHFNAALIIKNMMKGKNWNPENKYWGMTAEEIKKKWSQDGLKAASLGTALHYAIECFMNIEEKKVDEEPTNQMVCNFDNLVYTSAEWSYFLEFIKAFPHLKPYRTEWRVYDEDIKLAGSIDMVYENEDGTLSIYDWKRCKEISKTSAFKKHAKTACINYIPDTNFWHYSLQLNTYKAILERKYGKIIKDLYLVQLHEENPRKTFELIKCADLSNEIDKLFELKKRTSINNSINQENDVIS